LNRDYCSVAVIVSAVAFQIIACCDVTYRLENHWLHIKVRMNKHRVFQLQEGGMTSVVLVKKYWSAG